MPSGPALVGSRGPIRVAVALLAGAAILTGCSPASQEADPEVANAGYEAGDSTYSWWEQGERDGAIDLVGTTFEGEDVDLAQWRGGITVINFWYAACPPCRAEAPDLAAISSEYADDGVRFLGVNGTDDAATVAAFNETFAITYPSLDDSDAGAVAAMEGRVPLRATPTTVLLDPQGRPAAVIVGIAHGSTLRGLIEDLLAEG